MDKKSSEPVVKVRGLTKRYGSTLAVDRVDLTVGRGEVYGFLGPNGAGKTTTLRILTGLIAATDGSVEVLGGRPGAAEVLGRTGSLIEAPALYPYLSGRDNLRLLARYAEVPAARRASKTYGAVTAVDRVNLSVWRGEVYGFLGPNGAGKTTTLRILAGLVTADRRRGRAPRRPAGGAASPGPHGRR